MISVYIAVYMPSDSASTSNVSLRSRSRVPANERHFNESQVCQYYRKTIYAHVECE